MELGDSSRHREFDAGIPIGVAMRVAGDVRRSKQSVCGVDNGGGADVEEQRPVAERSINIS